MHLLAVIAQKNARQRQPQVNTQGERIQVIAAKPVIQLTMQPIQVRHNPDANADCLFRVKTLADIDISQLGTRKLQ